MNWITKQIQETMSDIILSFVEFFQEMVVEIFDKGTNFATNKQISGAVNATTLIGIALVSVMVLKQILSVYVFETDGDAETDPLQLIVKASQTVCIICCNDRSDLFELICICQRTSPEFYYFFQSSFLQM